ncbi:MAG: hypothetical protein ICV51_18065 [Flavisolibacter sp.]|nr:hypothetical protein [Flavisolibacter sp.]
MKAPFITAFAFVALFGIGCKEQTAKQSAAPETQAISPKGELVPAEHFTGKA